MNAPDNVTHEQAFELLPWLVNGSLDDAERTAIARHARFCVACRRELDSLERIQQAMVSQSAVAAAPAPDLRQINLRIDEIDAGRNRLGIALGRVRRLFGNPWRTAFVAQAVILAIGVAFWLGSEPRQTEFTTLTGSAELARGQYRVVFSPQFSLVQIDELVADLELEVIAGPTPRGVYTLAAAPSANRAVTLAALRGEPGVLFAEPAPVGERE